MEGVGGELGGRGGRRMVELEREIDICKIGKFRVVIEGEGRG